MRESYPATWCCTAPDLIAVILGVVLSLWPVIPGFVFVLTGLALLNARSEWTARRPDRLELAVRKILPRR